jgi:UDP-3-O-[3-hydroxymyristoyl] glucosamine N-acyltransferase
VTTRWRIDELALRLNARVQGDGSAEVSGVATLGSAGAGQLSFLANRRYRPQLDDTRAAAVILDEEFADACPCVALVMPNPYLGYARAAALMNPAPAHRPGVSPAASVDPQAQVSASAHVGAGAVVEAGATIGERVYVGPGCVISGGACVGNDSRLTANVTLCDGVSVGQRVLLHPGVVLGADGFGIANDDGVWVKVPQLGGVRIGDDVEIGANTTVDRGALEDTVIENGVKLDNQIQVGHNVHIGEHTAVAACVAIGGSARIGKRCTIGGAASLAGHLELADDVHLTATSAVPNSINKPGVYSSGMPVQDNRSWRKNVIRMRQLDDMARSLRALRAQVESLVGGSSRPG